MCVNFLLTFFSIWSKKHIASRRTTYEEHLPPRDERKIHTPSCEGRQVFLYPEEI